MGDDSSKLLFEAVDYARQKNVLFVAAAGNGKTGVGFDNDREPHPILPCGLDLENVICVAASDQEGKLAVFSNFGLKTVHIAAPGVQIFSTVPENGYEDVIDDGKGQIGIWSGTSMSAPHVAGAAALLLSEFPTLGALGVKDLMLRSTFANPPLRRKVSSGGILNLARAFSSVPLFSGTTRQRALTKLFFSPYWPAF